MLRHNVSPLSITLAILLAYVALTLLLGWFSSRRSRSASDYLNASRTLPLPVVTAAYLAANCGALEIVGLSAMAAQYGVQAFHFYWIGAVPGMIFLALFMMPIYRRGDVRSVPEYLEFRFGSRLRLLNAIATALILLLLSGISLYALGQVLRIAAGVDFGISILVCGAVVMVYLLLGGLRATIYTEVLQLAVMLAGLLPLAVHSMRVVKELRSYSPGEARFHLWQGMPLMAAHARMDVVGVVFGLTCVLSLGYWCTDFVLMQRAFTARTEEDARQVPLWAGFGKLIFSLLVVLPGLAAFPFLSSAKGSVRFDQALPMMMHTVYGPVMMGVGLTALVASLMSSLAGNVTGFASLCIQDIYRKTLAPHRTEAHYLRMSRLAIIVAVPMGIAACYLNFFFANLMEHVQLIFSIFAAPFWAVFVLGITSKRTTEKGALFGFLGGCLLSLLHLLAVRLGWLHYGSVMTSNFYASIYAFVAAILIGRLASDKRSSFQEDVLVLSWRQISVQTPHRLWVLSAFLLAACVLLNVYWR